MASTPITPEQRALVIELHGKGLGRNEIHRQSGVSLGTVTKIVHDAGLTFDRAATRAATAARQDDLAEKRSRNLDGMYSQAIDLLDRLKAPTFKTILKGSLGVEDETTLDFVPARDVRDLADAASKLAMAAARLEQVSNPQAEKVKGLLGGIADQLGL